MIKWVLSKPLLKFSWYPCKISTYSLSSIMSFLLLEADLKLGSVLKSCHSLLTLVGRLRFCYSFYIGIYIDNKIKIILWIGLEFKCTRAYLFHLHKELLNCGFVVGVINLKIKCVKNASCGIQVIQNL